MPVVPQAYGTEKRLPRSWGSRAASGCRLARFGISSGRSGSSSPAERLGVVAGDDGHVDAVRARVAGGGRRGGGAGDPGGHVRAAVVAAQP